MSTKMKWEQAEILNAFPKISIDSVDWPDEYYEGIEKYKDFLVAKALCTANEKDIPVWLIEKKWINRSTPDGRHISACTEVSVPVVGPGGPSLAFLLMAVITEGSNSIDPSLKFANDTHDQCLLAMNLANPENESAFFIWARPAGLDSREIKGKSLGLPIYLAAKKLQGLLNFNNILSSGEINSDGKILPVGGIFEKSSLCTDERIFLYPYESKEQPKKGIKAFSVDTIKFTEEIIINGIEDNQEVYNIIKKCNDKIIILKTIKYAIAYSIVCAIVLDFLKPLSNISLHITYLLATILSIIISIYFLSSKILRHINAKIKILSRGLWFFPIFLLINIALIILSSISYLNYNTPNGFLSENIQLVNYIQHEFGLISNQNVGLLYNNSNDKIIFDAKKILSEKNITWTRDNFNQAIRNGDHNTYELFLKGGMSLVDPLDKELDIIQYVQLLNNNPTEFYKIISIGIKYGLNLNKPVYQFNKKIFIYANYDDNIIKYYQSFMELTNLNQKFFSLVEIFYLIANNDDFKYIKNLEVLGADYKNIKIFKCKDIRDYFETMLEICNDNSTKSTITNYLELLYTQIAYEDNMSIETSKNNFNSRLKFHKDIVSYFKNYDYSKQTTQEILDKLNIELKESNRPFYFIGSIYFNGIGIDKNLDKAFENFQIAASHADIDAINGLAAVYGSKITKITIYKNVCNY